MKIPTSIAAGFLFTLFACGQAPPPKQVKNVSPADFKKEIETNPNLIVLDVRTPEEVASGTINNASVINFYDQDFSKKILLLDKTKIIAVYCKAGGRSSQAAQTLAANGFEKVINLEGGIMAWENQGYPLTKTQIVGESNNKQLTLLEYDNLIKSKELVLIDFNTRWCAPCRKMAPIVDDLEKEFEGKASIKRIDCDQSKEVVNKLNISGVPVFIIYKNGKEVWRKNGALPKEEIQKALNSYL